MNKKKVIFQKIIFLCFCLPILLFAESFSFSKSQSGFLDGKSYYYNIYQYAYWHGDEISESHSFFFSGILSDEEDATLLGKADKWLIYEGRNYFFAIPIQKDVKIYLKKKFVLDCPSGKYKDWIAISDVIK